MNHTYVCGGEYPGPPGDHDVIVFICPPGTRGNSITIKKKENETFLSLCEVEAYGDM